MKVFRAGIFCGSDCILEKLEGLEVSRVEQINWALPVLRRVFFPSSFLVPEQILRFLDQDSWICFLLSRLPFPQHVWLLRTAGSWLFNLAALLVLFHPPVVIVFFCLLWSLPLYPCISYFVFLVFVPALQVASVKETVACCKFVSIG